MTEAYKEKYRLQYHFSPKENWMNDPNGLVYFKGEYHLFYQYTPFSNTPEFNKMHWGHAASKDLTHWEELPVALYPDENGAIFSGSIVVDWNNTSGFFNDEPGLIAIYTSHDIYPETDRFRQRQSIAYSKDDGRTWINYEENPVLSDLTATDFRDPKVFWFEDTKRWVMVLATAQTISFYTSPNLIEWRFVSEFGETAGSHACFWECPDLFKLSIDNDEGNQKWVMLVSVGDTKDSKEGSKTQYFIGHFDGTTFVNDNSDETILWLDYGRDNFAGVSWSDMPVQDGRRIYMGWMSNWHYAQQIPTEYWRGAMTLPRELSLTSSDLGVSLIQKPLLELSTIRKNISHYQEQTIESNNPFWYSLSHSSIEINIEFEKISSNYFGITLQHSDSEKTMISYDAQLDKLFVDRTNAGESGFSPSFSSIREAPMKMIAGRIKLQIFLDASSVEVFANDGGVVITSLIFPSEPCQKIGLISNGGSTKLVSLTLTELDSIWNK